MYPVTADPPSSIGAAHVTAIFPVPSGRAVICVGAEGAYTGEGFPLITDAIDKPVPFLAWTDTEYAVPFTNPVTVVEVTAAVVVTVLTRVAPFLTFTTYPEIGFPPLNAGVDHDGVSDPVRPNTWISCGGRGAVAGSGTPQFEGTDIPLVPAAFVAVIVT